MVGDILTSKKIEGNIQTLNTRKTYVAIGIYHRLCCQTCRPVAFSRFLYLYVFFYCFKHLFMLYLHVSENVKCGRSCCEGKGEMYCQAVWGGSNWEGSGGLVRGRGGGRGGRWLISNSQSSVVDSLY